MIKIAALNDSALEDTQNKQIRETVRQTRSGLLSFIRRRLPNADDAEDVLQDVFYELTALFRLETPVEKLSAWLFRVARNKITDRLRKKKPDLLEDLLFTGSGEEDEPLLLAEILPALDILPDQALMGNMFWESLSNALDALPEAQRWVFEQHEIEGKSFKELSAETGLTINTLLSQKRYAVLHLRAQLQDLYTDFI